MSEDLEMNGARYSVGGVILTDDLIEKWAAPWDSGGVEGRPGPITVGRPRLSHEELATVSFKLPESWLGWVDAKALVAGMTRSEMLRGLIEREMRSSTE